jgi:pyruvate/2-oxoglutarate dehydrogenase complex dihydrolipoamide acyltransferase (E2) component
MNASYQIVPFPKIRRLMVDGGHMARQKHLVHGLLELDVTDARRLIREHKAKTGEALSFTAFIAGCLARAVDMNKPMQAYRAGRERLVIFAEVDINTLFEVEVEGRQIIRPHILHAANRRSLRDIHEEIRTFQSEHESGQEARFIGWFVHWPAFARRFYLRMLFRNPHRLKALNGTVSLSSVGMFGAGGGWGIPMSSHTLQVTLGGIAERAALIAGHWENREFLGVTISIDHDIVDGAPAARFSQQLRELVENSYGIAEFVGETG